MRKLKKCLRDFLACSLGENAQNICRTINKIYCINTISIIAYIFSLFCFIFLIFFFFNGAQQPITCKNVQRKEKYVSWYLFVCFVWWRSNTYLYAFMPENSILRCECYSFSTQFTVHASRKHWNDRETTTKVLMVIYTCIFFHFRMSWRHSIEKTCYCIDYRSNKDRVSKKSFWRGGAVIFEIVLCFWFYFSWFVASFTFYLLNMYKCWLLLLINYHISLWIVSG